MQNPELQLAEQFALYTNRSFFLTGKAGTGKTTLLRNIARQTLKSYAIVAPTGVAAINAGGVTIHSQFNLPLTAFVPNGDRVDLNVFTNRRALMEHMNFRRDKRKVIQEMEMLIVDEVSMVRADILDAMDFVMRTVRRNQRPFGRCAGNAYWRYAPVAARSKRPRVGSAEKLLCQPLFFRFAGMETTGSGRNRVENHIQAKRPTLCSPA